MTSFISLPRISTLPFTSELEISGFKVPSVFIISSPVSGTISASTTDSDSDISSASDLTSATGSSATGASSGFLPNFSSNLASASSYLACAASLLA